MKKNKPKVGAARKRRMLIVDVETPDAPLQKSRADDVILSEHPAQAAFRELMEYIEASRLKYRCIDVERAWPGWRWKAESLFKAGDILGHLAGLKQSAQLAFMAAWARKEIPGPVTDLSLDRQALKLERLADWRSDSGDDATSIKNRAEQVRAMTPESVSLQFKLATQKDYSPMAKLPASMQETLKRIIGNGGTVTEEALEGLKIDPRVMKKLLDNKLIEQPSANLYRVVESAVTAAQTEEQKEAAKAATSDKPSKETKPPKAPKPPKEPKPPRPKKEAVNPSELCLCGCSEKVPATSRFRPGHDAKLHSLILKLAKATDAGDKEKLAELKKGPAMFKPSGKQGELQLAYLAIAPWVDAPIKKTLGL